MKIKKFTAETMKEALVKVKAELGDDAMILKSQKLPKFPGRKGGFEVTAAVDEGHGSVSPGNLPDLQNQLNSSRGGEPRQNGFNRSYTDHLRHLSARGEELRTRHYEDAQPPQSSPSSSYAQSSSPRETSEGKQPVEEKSGGIQIIKLHDEISEMRKLLASILATGETRASGGYAGPWAILYKRLIDSGIKEDIARDLLTNLKQISPNPGREINEQFMGALADSFPTSNNTALDRVQLFAGPTGAGKTTTIAKLAAYFSLEKNKRVSLITSDTYRIAAVEQLRAYADIIGVDLQVAFKAEDISDMLRECTQSDIVLVDTAGRSQNHKEHLDELDRIVATLSPDALHLVLSAGTKEDDLRDIIRRYRRFKINRLVFTKLDETTSLGNVYNIVNEFLIPVSYLTCGQTVPDDIEFAQSGVFVKKLLERSSL
jgi:flagellar biosynthesis protein FlhF